jgi:hypothetical protein
MSVTLKVYYDDSLNDVVSRISSLVKPMGVNIEYIEGDNDGWAEYKVSKERTDHYLVVAGNEFGLTEKKVFKHSEKHLAEDHYHLLKGVEFHAELRYVDEHGKEEVIHTHTEE